MLEIKNVTKKFGSLVAVDDLSVSITQGEIFALLGPNGAGKTTTFRMITGLLKPNSGTIIYNGHQIGYDDSDEIGFLVEERALMTKLKVKDLIIHYGRLKNITVAEIEKRLQYWLEFFNITDYYNKPIKELSKGNQQKIQFISAIINNPKLLILDEPFSGLDPLNIEKMIEAIRHFQNQGTIIIFSTHRIDHVELFCEQLVVLQHGKSVLAGNIEKIKDDFKRKTITLQGNAKKEDLLKIKGVLSVKENLNSFEISIEDESYKNNVFEYVKSLNNVTKFIVEKPSLSEIFIAKVGKAYDA